MKLISPLTIALGGVLLHTQNAYTRGEEKVGNDRYNLVVITVELL